MIYAIFTGFYVAAEIAAACMFASICIRVIAAVWKD